MLLESVRPLESLSIERNERRPPILPFSPTTGILVALGTKAKFDAGYNLSGALGYHWGKLRLEGEIAYAENDFDTVEIVGIKVGANGDLSSLGFMLNAFRDFEISGPWHVYLGGGAGLAIVSINDLSIVGVPLADDDDTVFAYQLGTGAGYGISPSSTLTLDYRFFSTLDPDFKFLGGLPFEAEYDSHNIRIGVRFTF